MTAARSGGKKGRKRGGGGDLTSWQRQRIALLGLPAFGMALAITAVSTYLPVIAREFHAPTTAIGLIIGAEGLLALWMPLLIGAWSDRLRTSIGGRLPFVLAGTPVMVVSLAVVGAVGSLLAMALIVLVFFIGYFIAYEPYRALYPDLVRDEAAGRSQSVQAGWRGLGTGVALLSGGSLLAVSPFLPFVAYAVLLAASIALFFFLLLRRGYRERVSERGRGGRSGRGSRQTFSHVWGLIRKHPALRFYIVANALWELSLGALKTFVFLYVSAGLGYSLSQASLIIGGVAVVVLVGALVSGKLGDRYGRLRVTEVGLWVYGPTLLVPALTTSPALLLPVLPFVAFGGGMLMGLPYSLLMPLMPDAEHGVLTGLYSLSRGLGVMLGPLAAGAVIELAKPAFSSTQGYGAMWLVSSAAILLSIPALRRLRAAREDRRLLRLGEKAA